MMIKTGLSEVQCEQLMGEEILSTEKYYTSVKYYVMFTKRLTSEGEMSGSLAGDNAQVQGQPCMRGGGLGKLLKLLGNRRLRKLLASR